MRKKDIFISMVFVVLISITILPTVNSGSVFAEDVFQIANYNCGLVDLGYDSITKELTFKVIPIPTNYSVGLGLLMLKFNNSRAPDFQNVSAISYNDTDMLKNYTFTDSLFFPTSISNGIPCKLLKIYFYLFDNHSVINEKKFDYPSDWDAKPLSVNNNEITIKITGVENVTEQTTTDIIDSDTLSTLIPLITFISLYALVIIKSRKK